MNTPVTRGLYRWHIPDPIYFEHDLRVEWQQIGTEEGGNFERQDDVASVGSADFRPRTCDFQSIRSVRGCCAVCATCVLCLHNLGGVLHM